MDKELKVSLLKLYTVNYNKMEWKVIDRFLESNTIESHIIKLKDNGADLHAQKKYMVLAI